MSVLTVFRAPVGVRQEVRSRASRLSELVVTSSPRRFPLGVPFVGQRRRGPRPTLLSVCVCVCDRDRWADSHWLHVFALRHIALPRGPDPGMPPPPLPLTAAHRVASSKPRPAVRGRGRESAKRLFFLLR